MTEASEEAARRYFQGLYCNDRKKWLCAFGILWIILGAYNVYAVLSKASQANTSWLLWKMLLGAWCIWMGIGSMMARRWARTLILASSWYWLIWGIRYLVEFLVWRPDVYGQWAQEGWISTSYAMERKISLLGTMFIGRILVPYVSIRFFGSKHVKATCERRDCQARWTDKCPVSVLVISFVFAVWACLGLLARFDKGWITTSLGTILTGPAGATEILIVTTLCVYVAWGAYHLKIGAWWAAVLIVTYSIVESIIPVSEAGYPPQLIELLRLQTWGQDVFYCIWYMAFLVYLLYARRFFVRPAPIPLEAETASADGGAVH